MTRTTAIAQKKKDTGSKPAVSNATGRQPKAVSDPMCDATSARPAEQTAAALPETMPAHEIVSALFAVVSEEAERNEAFARRLLSVFPEAVVARIEKPQKRLSSFDPAAYHAVNILRSHGEAMLRGRLSSIRTKAQLRQVATRSGLKLTGPAARNSASLAHIVDGIVEAAKTYLAQRDVATR